MTKKYMVESSTIVRRMLGWLEIPVLMLTKTITENVRASESKVHVERGILKNVDGKYQRPGIVPYTLAQAEEST